MHPGPVNRGVETTSSVADGDASVIHEQVTNGVAVRKALMFLLTRRADGMKVLLKRDAGATRTAKNGKYDVMIDGGNVTASAKLSAKMLKRLIAPANISCLPSWTCTSIRGQAGI